MLITETSVQMAVVFFPLNLYAFSFFSFDHSGWNLQNHMVCNLRQWHPCLRENLQSFSTENYVCCENMIPIIYQVKGIPFYPSSLRAFVLKRC